MIQSTQESYQYLYDRSLIYPGSTIPKEEVEAAIGIPFEETWKFRGACIDLTQFIQEKGFFTTESGIEKPSFRLLESHEMANHAYSKLVKRMLLTARNAHTLAMHDISKLDENGQKRHNNVQLKAAQISLMQQKMIFDEKFF